MKKIYIILTYFDFEEKRKLFNDFIFIFDSYNIFIYEVIRNITPGLKVLSEGIIVKINYIKTLVKVFLILLIFDILIRINNSGFIKYNINYNYRIYFYPKEKKGDIYYNTKEHRRYYFNIIYLREEG